MWSVGLLPKIAGYKAYIVEGQVSALLRGRDAAGAGLGGAGGHRVARVQRGRRGGRARESHRPASRSCSTTPRPGLAAVSRPPVVFVAVGAAHSIADPPTGEPLKLPWIGVIQMVGLTQGSGRLLRAQRADGRADRRHHSRRPGRSCGVKPGEIITRGERRARFRAAMSRRNLPMILRRRSLAHEACAGRRLRLTGCLDPAHAQEPRCHHGAGASRPMQPNLAERFYAEDLGFSVREMVSHGCLYPQAGARHQGRAGGADPAAVGRPERTARGATT